MTITHLPVPADPRELARQDVQEQIAVLSEHARAWLREATELSAVQETKARAAAVEVYLRQIQAGKQAEFDAAVIVRRAERRQGELQREERKNGQRGRGKSAHRGKEGSSNPPSDTKAADAMALGTDEAFEHALGKAKAEGKRPTRGRIKRELAPDPVADAEAEAKRAQQRLRDEVRTLAKRVDKITELGDAPSSLALLLDAPESKAIKGLALDVWIKAAEEARAVLDRWIEQLARAKASTP